MEGRTVQAILQEQFHLSVSIGLTVEESLSDHIEDSAQTYSAVFWPCINVVCLESNTMADLAHFNEWVYAHSLGTESTLIVRRSRLLLGDEVGQMCSATSKAIKYPNGWDLYVWYGLLVPERAFWRQKR